MQSILLKYKFSESFIEYYIKVVLMMHLQLMYYVDILKYRRFLLFYFNRIYIKVHSEVHSLLSNFLHFFEFEKTMMIFKV